MWKGGLTVDEVFSCLGKMEKDRGKGLLFIDLDSEPGRMGLYDLKGQILAGCDFVPPQLRKEVLKSGKPGIRELERGRIYGELILPVPVLVILGGGHIARPLAGIGDIIGLRTWVVDDRKEFASRERFPAAEKVLPRNFIDFFQEFQPGEEHFLVIVTRGHRHDLECAREALQTPAPYIGMIGSRRKVNEVLQKLKEEGFSPKNTGRIHAPIGLDIGAETPAEIAVSIAAEIIREIPCRERSAPWQEILPALEKGGILATVVSARGSTPRGAGSRLFFKPDGRVVGTVGGGAGEARVIEKARELMGTNKTELIDFELDQDIAAEEGMICGGTFSVFLQPVE